MGQGEPLEHGGDPLAMIPCPQTQPSLSFSECNKPCFGWMCGSNFRCAKRRFTLCVLWPNICADFALLTVDSYAARHTFIWVNTHITHMHACLPSLILIKMESTVSTESCPCLKFGFIHCLTLGLWSDVSAYITLPVPNTVPGMFRHSIRVEWIKRQMDGFQMDIQAGRKSKKGRNATEVLLSASFSDLNFEHLRGKAMCLWSFRFNSIIFFSAFPYFV